MKNLKTLILIGILAVNLVTFNGCSKKNESTPTPTPTPTVTPTSLTINVTNNLGAAASSATVNLYSSLTDLQNSTNLVATATTDANGKVVFSSNMSSINYFWWISLGCQNNNYGTYTTTNPLTANANNSYSVQLSQTGTLKMISTSANPYALYINGTFVENLAGGVTKYYNNIATGTLTVRVLQLSGYVITPTDETFYPSISCGNTSSIVFP